LNRFVIDASVAIKWVIAEPETNDSLHLRRAAELLAPDLVIAETSNILWKAVRRGEMSAEMAQLAAETLLASDIVLTPMGGLMTRATRMAVDLDHAAYDCFYLALAKAEDCPLVTADQKLARKVAASSGPWPSVVSIREAAELAGSSPRRGGS
jgi:predicted nucleic acid-binding protein